MTNIKYLQTCIFLAACWALLSCGNKANTSDKVKDSLKLVDSLNKYPEPQPRMYTHTIKDLLGGSDSLVVQGSEDTLYYRMMETAHLPGSFISLDYVTDQILVVNSKNERNLLAVSLATGEAKDEIGYPDFDYYKVIHNYLIVFEIKEGRTEVVDYVMVFDKTIFGFMPDGISFTKYPLTPSQFAIKADMVSPATNVEHIWIYLLNNNVLSLAMEADLYGYITKEENGKQNYSKAEARTVTILETATGGLFDVSIAETITEEKDGVNAAPVSKTSTWRWNGERYVADTE